MEISLNFEDSIQCWFEAKTAKKYPPGTMCPIRKILGLMRNKLINEETNLNNNADFFIDFCKKKPEMIEKAFHDVIKDILPKMNPITVNSYASGGRRALVLMGIEKNRLKVPAKQIKAHTQEFCLLPPSIRCLSDEDSMKKFFVQRLDSLKKTSKIHSDLTLRNAMRTWVRFLKLYPENERFEDHDFTVKNVIELLKQFLFVRSMNCFIDLFHMFEKTTPEWSALTLKKFKELCIHNGLNPPKKETCEKDGDVHRLTAKQQENLLVACETSFEKLLISLVLTTGLRVGGLQKILKDEIISQDGNIKEYGRTMEKGKKFRTFPVVPLVHPSLKMWIEENRSIDSKFLFPNTRYSDAPTSLTVLQNAFKTIAKRAGINGPEAHIHAARHSVAFNLLESGNSMEKIGKFLGHSDPSTTAKFYARMSSKETIERMNTECIGGKNLKDEHKADLPNFTKAQEKEKRKKTKVKSLKCLKDLVINVQ